MATALAELEQPGGVLAVIERAALNPDIDVEKMKALFELQERIMARHAEMSFSSAFAEMQSEIPTITEHGRIMVNGVERSKYALFEDINDTVKPILQRHGFGVTFKTKTGEGGVTVTGILMHRDGHREDTDMTLQADISGSKNGVQSIGSSVSYAKRYVLCALLNISTRGEDDDGQAAGVEKITEKQAADLQALIDEVKANKQQFLKYVASVAKIPVTTLEQIPARLYADAVKALEKKRRT